MIPFSPRQLLLTLAIGVQLVLAVEALRRQVSVTGVLWLIVVIGASLACDYRLTGALLVLLFALNLYRFVKNLLYQHLIWQQEKLPVNPNLRAKG